MTIPNIWHLFNLRESPFFQDTLRAGENERYPLDLFVGREREVERLLAAIAGSSSSRQTIAGAPGIGKSTLAQRVKDEAVRAGYLSHANPLSFESGDTTAALLIRLLSYVYESLVSHSGEELDVEAVQTARQLVRVFRIRNLSASVSLLGVGGGGGVTTQLVESGMLSPSLVVPLLLRELAEVASNRLGAAGLLVHANNLENLAEADRERAGQVVRDVRDLLLLPGYHFLFVGTSNAVHEVVSTSAQVRSVFSLADPLQPLMLAEFRVLLEKRYEYLRLETARRVAPPIEERAVEEIYVLFAGDLRGTLRALDQAAHELVGYSDPPAAPLTAEEIRTVLQPRYRIEMEAQLGPTLTDYLDRLAGTRERSFTQAELRKRWGASKSTVSEVLSDLQRFGYVEEKSRQGRQILYRLTGSARLVLDPST